ncbi:MAG: AAA family ATPase [Kofleriaceae bacterium]|nr:AAA family ATPase [Kofleriaceae bacterium]MBP9167467.1 AAA family ATPase [Kofleriaceae bacterium]MBP9861043.1 AAA family ATPase [Kofleriaceae bacterium]
MPANAPNALASQVFPPAPERLRALRDHLLADLVERDVAMRLALLAALAGEHLLLLGPPGTAKSLLARRLRMAFHDATYFERLLTRFSVPEELFGPLSIKGLEQDRYERLTEAYLPSAAIAFLDEIFKANSAILNALLTLLNEREFDNGTRRVRVPLVAVIGASNEQPEGEELDALFDRFLLRLHVAPVSAAGFPTLLGLRGDAAPSLAPDLPVTDAELAAFREARDRVEVPAVVLALLVELRAWAAAERLPVSDRRWRKIVRLLQTSACSNGRTAVSTWDAWLLQYCVGATPEDQRKVYAWYASRVGATAAVDPARLTKVVIAWESKVQHDQEDRTQARDERGRKLYIGAAGETTANGNGPVPAVRDTEPLYLAPPTFVRGGDRTNGGRGYTLAELNSLSSSMEYFAHWHKREAYLADPNSRHTVAGPLAPLLEPTRHKRVYIDDCLSQIAAVQLDIQQYLRDLGAHILALQADIAGHLWVSPDFAAPAARTLEDTRTTAEKLLLRIGAVAKGYDRLPVAAPIAASDGVTAP